MDNEHEFRYEETYVYPNIFHFAHKHCNFCNGCMGESFSRNRANCDKCAGEITARKKAKGQSKIHVNGHGTIDLSTSRKNKYNINDCLCCKNFNKP